MDPPCWRTLPRFTRRWATPDSAVAEIEHLLSIPGWLSPPLLRIDQKWAPLRSDPRFRKLAETRQVATP